MNTSEKITVALIDKQQLFMEGMKQIIEENASLTVTALGKNVQDTLAVAKQNRPHLMLIDVQLFQQEGFTDLKKSLLNASATKVILLSDHHYSTENVINALSNGVRGFLLRTMDETLFMDAILSIYQGNYWLHPKVSHCLASEFKQLRDKYTALKDRKSKSVQKPLHTLTNRECDVLDLIVKGDSNSDIARKLDITEFTVKNHVRNILGKMHVNNRTNAVVFAIKNGWAEVETEKESI